MCPLNANQSSCRPPVEIFISELSLLKLILSRLENILGPQSNESHLCRHVTLYAILAFALTLLLLKTERISGCRDMTEKLLVIVQSLNMQNKHREHIVPQRGFLVSGFQGMKVEHATQECQEQRVRDRTNSDWLLIIDPKIRRVYLKKEYCVSECAVYD